MKWLRKLSDLVATHGELRRAGEKLLEEHQELTNKHLELQKLHASLMEENNSLRQLLQAHSQKLHDGHKELVWWKEKALTFMDLHKGKNG